jgi:autotransporter-associated beta strand protein
MLSHGKGCTRTGLVLSLLCAATLPPSRAVAASGSSGDGYRGTPTTQAYRDAVPYSGSGGESDGVRTYRGTTTIDTGATLMLDTWSPPGVIVDDGSLIVRASACPLSLADVTGFGSLVQAGPGTTTLTGRSTYTGATVVSAGRLALASGSTGIASSASVTVTGGVLDLTAVDDQLLRTLSEDAGGTLALAVGTDPAVTVVGAAVLAGAVEITLRPGTPAGLPLTLVHTSGSQGVTGSFAGLPEGAALTVGGGAYLITYKGDGGHDVVLMPAATASAQRYAGPMAAAPRSTVAAPGATVFLTPARAVGEGSRSVPFSLVLAFSLAVVAPVTALALVLRRRRPGTVGARHRGARW